MPDLSRIQRAYSRGNLDRVVTVEGRQVWAKRLEDDAGETVESVADTLVTFTADRLTAAYVIHYDPAVLPGQQLTDEGEALTVDAVTEVGRARFMLLRCSAQTPAATRDLVA